MCNYALVGPGSASKTSGTCQAQLVSVAALLVAQLECQEKAWKSIILDPKSISKKSWRKHGGNIPRFRSCLKRPIFTENSWDYWDHGPIQRKMLELREKVPLKTSEEKCCVLQ